MRKFEKGNCNSSRKKSTSGQEKKTGSARKSPKRRGSKLKLLPGQARIVEYFGRKDKQEVRKSLSPTQGTSNGSLEGVLDLCTPRKTSTGVANPLPEERGGEGGKESTEEDQIGSGEMALHSRIQTGKLRGVARHYSRHPGW